MTRGKIFTNLGFVAGEISEEQLVEFEKINSELREFFCKESRSSNKKTKRKKKLV